MYFGQLSFGPLHSAGHVVLLLRQVARVLIQENKVGVKDSKLELDGLPLSVSTILKKLDNEQNRLSKTVQEKMRLRHCNTLWYNPEDGPYSVGTKWK